MDMVPLPHTVSRSYGPAMLPAIADSVGFLLVFGGLLGHLAAAAGVPAGATPSPALNHSAYRYDGLHRRSPATQLRPAVLAASQSTTTADAVATRRHRGEPFQASEAPATASPVPESRSPEGRFLESRSLESRSPEGRILESRSPESRSPEGRSLLDGLALGTRVRPAVGARAAATTTALAARRKQSKKDDDDEGGGFFDDDDDDEDDAKDPKQAGTKTFKIKKHKLKKWLLPLLVGYKLKFMTLVPLLFATLALLVASAGFAGFFFAMFTAALTLGKSSSHHH